jgi:hypothetical protein
VSWGNTGVEVYAPNGTSIGFWDNDLNRRLKLLSTTEESCLLPENGVQRFNETSFQWEATWTSGNGLPSSTGNIIYELVDLMARFWPSEFLIKIHSSQNTSSLSWSWMAHGLPIKQEQPTSRAGFHFQ